LIAILSDIHGNLEALQAVLEDISSLGIREVVCLGDVVGYGPNPLECLRLARGFKLTVKGNHDEALVRGRMRSSRVAAKAMAWTRSVFNKGKEAEDERFLLSLREEVRQGVMFFAHASPLDPVREYIYPHHVDDPKKVREIMARVKKYAFVGHTHIPGVVEEGHKGFIRPKEAPEAHFLGGGKALINTGSVGQPRDGDPRACYVTFDGTAVVFRRVDYDVSSTVKKIKRIGELEDSLALRLERGR